MTSQSIAVKAAITIADREIRLSQMEVMQSLDEHVRMQRKPEAYSCVDVGMVLSRSQSMLERVHQHCQGHGNPIYMTEERFLGECCTELTRTDDEAMFFVTGFSMDGLRVLSRTIHLEYSEQSPVFVKADGASTRSALKELQDHGQSLLAWFHRHPGSGPEKTTPSMIDLDHQKDLEAGGYSAIGAIFTEDGWVRFFAVGAEFSINISGNGVWRENDNLFRITLR